jgi:hypothetical protein
LNPEWRDELKSKDFPQNPTPQYQLLGQQLDQQYLEKTARRLTVVAILVTVAVTVAAALSFIPQAMQMHSNMLQHKGTVSENPFAGKIQARVLGTQRVTTIEGLLGNVQAKQGFIFFIASVEITNLADQPYQLTPYAFALISQEKQRYLVHLAQRKLDQPLRQKKLSANEAISGDLVFEIPVHLRPQGLELSSYGGSTASVRF